MEEKVKISIPKVEIKEIDFCGQKIKMYSFITLENASTIIKDLKEHILYNEEIKDKYLFLQARFIRDVLELCTNIDVSELDGEDFCSPKIENLLVEIDNFDIIEQSIDKEYDKWVIDNSFGLLSSSLPSAKDMDASMEKLAKTIEDLPEDKLELISKSIVWNNMPALGQQVAPATHNNLDVMAGA